MEGGIYALEFDTKNEYKKMTSDLETWCKAALQTVESENMARLVEETVAAPKQTDPEIILSSSITFTGDLTVNSLFGKVVFLQRLVILDIHFITYVYFVDYELCGSDF